MYGPKTGSDVFVLPWGSMYDIPGTDFYLVSEDSIVADITD